MYKFAIFLFCLMMGYAVADEEQDAAKVDEILKELQRGYDNEDVSARPTILGRVHIMANIYNAITAKAKNVTSDPESMKDTLASCLKRVQQLRDYQNLSLAFMEREAKTMKENFLISWDKVKKGELTGQALVTEILPFTTKFGYFAERLNGLLNDGTAKSLIADYREESMKLFKEDEGKYKEIVDNMGAKLLKMLDHLKRQAITLLKKPSLSRRMTVIVKLLENADPNEEFDVFRWQYEMDRGLYATKLVLKTIIQCEAIMENEKDPFVRESNTIDDERSREFFH